MIIPLVPTPEMLEAGANALAKANNSVFPDSFWKEQAEKVWRAMWTTALVDVLMEYKDD